MERGQERTGWFRRTRHSTSSAGSSVASLFLIDGWVILACRNFSHSGENTWASILLAGLVTGPPQLAAAIDERVFSPHEGAAHGVVFVGNSQSSARRQVSFDAICAGWGSRARADAARHMAHHSKFGTEHDSEFLNFVLPRRYWLTFLPFAAFINFTDFSGSSSVDVHEESNHRRQRASPTTAATRSSCIALWRRSRFSACSSSRRIVGFHRPPAAIHGAQPDAAR
jgi:hypothetical protein